MCRERLRRGIEWLLFGGASHCELVEDAQPNSWITHSFGFQRCAQPRDVGSEPGGTQIYNYRYAFERGLDQSTPRLLANPSSPSTFAVLPTPPLRDLAMSNFFFITIRDVASPQHAKHLDAHLALNGALMESGYIGASCLSHPPPECQTRRSMGRDLIVYASSFWCL